MISMRIISSGSTEGRPVLPQLSSYVAKLDEPIDRAQQMIRWNVLV